MTDAAHDENRLELPPGPSALRIMLPLLFIGGGVGIFMALKMTAPQANKTPEDDRGVLVTVHEAQAKTHDVEVTAQGRVTPARVVVLSPEVAGRIVWQHPALVPGGRIKAGAAVVRVDARDYKLALQQQQASADRARLELDIERSRKRVAEREWELLGGDTSGDTSGNLALREPQLRTAKVGVEAAQSGLSRARLAVGKTVVKAPFNAMVQAEQTEVGQLVGPQSPLATLVGTDHFWVQVSIPIDNLAVIAIPGVNAADDAGAEVRVSQQIGDQTVERPGRVVRLLGDLDPTGGMARVVVEIEDPLGLGSPQGEAGLPLLVGAFVDVRIAAGQVEDAFALPRTALRGGDRVYVIDAESRLAVRDVTVVWRSVDGVLVSAGVVAGDRVITSQVGDTIPGTRVRTEAAPPASAPAPATPEKDAS